MTAVAAARAPAPRQRARGTPGGALLLGADYRALGVARSLGRRGVPVWALREPGEPLAAFSRHVRHSLPWPSAGADRAAFLGRLAGAYGLDGWALIPTSDEAAALVARHHEELGRRFTHTIPPWDAVEQAYDKRRTYALAEALGVPCPRTRRPGRGGVAGLDVPFPAVVKPAVKASFNALTAAKAWRVDDAAQLDRRWADACELMDPEQLVVQELIPGGGAEQLSYAALCCDGEPLAELTARRTRQYPADFGRASTYVETVDCPEAVAPSRALLGALRWTGLAEVEYKRDPRDGVLKLLDVNPRVWGWQSLCGCAGVDFAYLLWLLVSGQPVPCTRPVTGVGWLRLSTDTPTVLRELRHGRLSPSEYLRSLRGPRAPAVFAWDDPLPGLSELPVLVALVARRKLAGGAV